MKTKRVHILALTLALVFSGAVVFFASRNPTHLDKKTTKLPEVFEQSVEQVELTFKAEPVEVKAGEKSTIKLILTNKGTATIKDIIYKIWLNGQKVWVKTVKRVEITRDWGTLSSL